jgi:hypothetical protein
MMVLVLGIILLPASGFGQDTGVTGAGEVTLPVLTLVSGIPITALDFGMGVFIPGDGTATGHFQATLLGIDLLGLLSLSIEVEGDASTGSISAGSRTFSGMATVDLLDGTLPLTMPFTVTATASSVLLTLGVIPLPLSPLTTGSITIQ